MNNSLIRIDPFERLAEVSDWFDRLFGPLPTPRTGRAGMSALPIDVFETEGKLVIKAAVPGIAPEDLNVSIEDRVLTIRGETKTEELAESARVYRREYSYGAFSRSLVLPEGVDVSQVDAEFDKGFVYVSMPLAQEPEPKTRKIVVRNKS